MLFKSLRLYRLPRPWAMTRVATLRARIERAAIAH